jgi:hypothetical protein
MQKTATKVQNTSLLSSGSQTFNQHRQQTEATDALPPPFDHEAETRELELYNSNKLDQVKAKFDKYTELVKS